MELTSLAKVALLIMLAYQGFYGLRDCVIRDLEQRMRTTEEWYLNNLEPQALKDAVFQFMTYKLPDYTLAF
eukprot:CAMPEP_0168625960 /NCGR_PEP_ID=MMETSP0449_2-20121227/10342_1 /TAXON_ID=1082188 /ORGANISM="Strombidium rassoulzadegani, Strain ras09" /LENGTH=70 /DNA_ID=CAMNT_0008667853 /DNA_START=1 /DNA_END=213 /DNA_ORIENTATION=+